MSNIQEKDININIALRAKEAIEDRVKEGNFAEFKNLAMKMPVFISQNGLLLTSLYLQSSEGGKVYLDLLKKISKIDNFEESTTKDLEKSLFTAIWLFRYAKINTLKEADKK